MQTWLIAELVRQQDHALAQEYARGWGMDAGAYNVQPAIIAAQAERDAAQYLQLPATTAWVGYIGAVGWTSPLQSTTDNGLPTERDRMQQRVPVG